MSLSTDKTTKKILPRLGSARNSHKNQQSENGPKKRDRVKGSFSKRLKKKQKTLSIVGNNLHILVGRSNSFLEGTEAVGVTHLAELHG